MRIFKLKFFNFKFFTLFLLIFLLSSKTVFAGFKGKITAETVQTIEAALTKVGVLKGAAHADELETVLRASTAAHRLRLSEIFLQVRKDENFVKKFPEYAELFKDPSKTVNALLKHDAGKADQEGKMAVRVLAMLQGYDYRNPNTNLPPEVDKVVRKVLKDAIDDINVLETKYPFPANSFGKSAESFAEVLDYYDTFKSRQDEIAKGGRKLLSPSEWLDFLYKKAANDPDHQKILDLQKRFANYLETHDPLKMKTAFTQTADVLKKVGSNAFEDVAKYFSHHGGQLAPSRTIATAKKMMAPLSKVSRRIPVATAAFASADYLLDPDDFSIYKTIEETVMSVTLTSQVSACQTVNCSEFIRECGEKLSVKNKYSFSEVTEHKEFSRCVFDFFQQPLDVQANKRNDPDLNNLLLEFSPSVRTLTCEQSGSQLKATIGTFKKDRESESQVVQFNQSGAVSIATLLPDRQDQIQFQGKNASTLRHCKTSTDCKQYEMDYVKNEMTYFWKDEGSMLPEKIVKKIPVQSFRWAKANSAFLEIQGENIKNCCNDLKCRQKLSGEDHRAPASRSSYVSIAH
jgi:hypothetical protein